ncbi:hypothetical protein [Planktosalinus lacus]|uniref:Apea-like HEPN domain-containing protein n=1 Tax=Planktosalinus lacus TaxID=1526573 RepID=A0A8J2YBJ5_9FLAO|nr:hypothetical protein [Planktosalinus lacus]GGD99641.1 hypothetical protein GCM10011312_23890 [Planktosalinus lacus]
MKFIKNIIFSKTPLNGLYRYKDKFQIYPINIDAAPSSPLTEHFPLIIEFCYDQSEVKKVKKFIEMEGYFPISEMTAQTNKLIQITNLLSTISNFRFFFYRRPEMKWAIHLPEKEISKMTEEMRAEYNKTSSKWSMLIYAYPNIGKDLEINEFSNPNVSKVNQTQHSHYYYYDPLESKKKSIVFPQTIDDILDKYYSLNEEEMKITNSGMHQFCNGLDIFSNMKSLSFFSFVSSIETLVNLEFKNEKIDFECNDCKTIKSSERTCQKCGRPIWGIAAKFREFLFKYVSDHFEAKKLYNKIYTVRSKITHTEYLISGDNFLEWDFTDKTEEVDMLHLKAMQLGRRSFANWLLKK